MISIILLVLIGLLSGWLINYLADVLPVTRRFTRPVCPHCQTAYNWRDYLLFHNCRSCGKRRNLRAFILQAVLTITPVILWLFPRNGFHIIPATLLLVYLSLVFVMDLEHRLVLHPVSLAGAILGLGIGIYLHGIQRTLIGGVVGFGIMLVFYLLGEVYIRYISKKRGVSTDEVALGFGDVNLAGVLGLLLGWPTIFVGLLFAVLAGGLISLIIILAMLLTKKYKSFTAIPYAPFLILSAIYLLYVI